MTGSFRISLKAGEKLYLNGAVIRFDRKTSLEVLNDVNFLLGSHVMQPESATTPLRQLYFMIQLMLMSPAEQGETARLYRNHMDRLIEAFDNAEIKTRLKDIDWQVGDSKYYDALKTLRRLFNAEAAILGTERPKPMQDLICRSDVFAMEDSP